MSHRSEQARAEPPPRRGELIDKATTFILVNMLWMVLAAPIVTLPPATAGLFATLTPWVRGQHSEPFRDFFGAMRRYALQSLAIVLADVVIGLVIWLNFGILRQMGTSVPAVISLSATIFVTLAAVAANGKVTDFQADNDAVRFTFTANALPWVLPPDALPGYQLVRAGHKYSMEGFSARNLKPGKYELKIDGQSVGMWADTQLAFRLELETNDKTPQYQQALSVAMLNKERNDKVIHPLRDLWLKRKVRLAQLGRQVAEKDPQADAKKEQFAKWIADEFQPAEAKLQAEARKYEDQIYQANQPAARKYELIRVK